MHNKLFHILFHNYLFLYKILFLTKGGIHLVTKARINKFVFIVIFSIFFYINIFICPFATANICANKQTLQKYFLNKYINLRTHLINNIIKSKHIKFTQTGNLSTWHVIESNTSFLDWSIIPPTFSNQDRLIASIYHTTAVEARAGFSESIFFMWRDKNRIKL